MMSPSWSMNLYQYGMLKIMMEIVLFAARFCLIAPWSLQSLSVILITIILTSKIKIFFFLKDKEMSHQAGVTALQKYATTNNENATKPTFMLSYKIARAGKQQQLRIF